MVLEVIKYTTATYIIIRTCVLFVSSETSYLHSTLLCTKIYNYCTSAALPLHTIYQDQKKRTAVNYTAVMLISGIYIS